MQWGRRKFLKPCCHKRWDMGVARSPKSKQQSMEWRHTPSQTKPDSSRPLQLGRSSAQCFESEKAFCLWTSCLKAPQSIAGVCCDTIKKLWRLIQNKRRGMLSRAVVMIHDNTCPHCNAKSHHDIWLGTIWSSPYSPDLLPSDFHLFMHLKSFLAGRQFHEHNEVKEAITTFFA